MLRRTQSMPILNIIPTTTVLLTLFLAACSSPATTEALPDAAPPDAAAAAIDPCKGIDCGSGKCAVEYGRVTCKCNAGFSNLQHLTQRCEACVPLPNPINIELPAVPVALILTNPDGQPVVGSVSLYGEGPAFAYGYLDSGSPQLVRPGKYSAEVPTEILKTEAFASFKRSISPGEVEITSETKVLRFVVPNTVPIEGRLPLKVGSVSVIADNGIETLLETPLVPGTIPVGRSGIIPDSDNSTRFRFDGLPGHYRILGVATSTRAYFPEGRRARTDPIAEFDVPTEGLKEPLDIPLELHSVTINHKISGARGVCKNCRVTFSGKGVELDSASFAVDEGTTVLSVPSGIYTPKISPAASILFTKPNKPHYMDPEVNISFASQKVETERTIDLNVTLVSISGKATMNQATLPGLLPNARTTAPVIEASSSDANVIPSLRVAVHMSPEGLYTNFAIAGQQTDLALYPEGWKISVLSGAVLASKKLDADAGNIDLDLVNRSVSFALVTPFGAQPSDIDLRTAASSLISVDSTNKAVLPFGKVEASLSVIDDRFRATYPMPPFETTAATESVTLTFEGLPVSGSFTAAGKPLDRVRFRSGQILVPGATAPQSAEINPELDDTGKFTTWLQPGQYDLDSNLGTLGCFIVTKN